MPAAVGAPIRPTGSRKRLPAARRQQLLLVGVAAAAVLAYLWWRNRSSQQQVDTSLGGAYLVDTGSGGGGGGAQGGFSGSPGGDTSNTHATTTPPPTLTAANYPTFTAIIPKIIPKPGVTTTPPGRTLPPTPGPSPIVNTTTGRDPGSGYLGPPDKQPPGSKIGGILRIGPPIQKGQWK